MKVCDYIYNIIKKIIMAFENIFKGDESVPVTSGNGGITVTDNEVSLVVSNDSRNSVELRGNGVYGNYLTAYSNTSALGGTSTSANSFFWGHSSAPSQSISQGQVNITTGAFSRLIGSNVIFDQAGLSSGQMVVVINSSIIPRRYSVQVLDENGDLADVFALSVGVNQIMTSTNTSTITLTGLDNAAFTGGGTIIIS